MQIRLFDLKRWPYFIVFVLVLTSSINASAQCTIQSNEYTCVDDLIAFNPTATQSITSVSWNFGDGNTSVLNAPSHRFAVAGTYTVKAVIKLADGTSCEVTKAITVYAPPKLNVSIHSSSTYCLTSNEVCLEDNSTSGGGGSKNVKRTILWGDGGKTDANNPQTGDKICYTYNNPGKFPITIEISNDKGCEAKQEIEIEILYDFYPKFTSSFKERNCDTQYNIFRIDTSWAVHFNDIKLAYYDFGDGTKDTLSPLTKDPLLHKFTKTGIYAVNLIAQFKNGCEVRYQKFVSVNVDRVVIDHKKLDTTKCFPGYFEFSHPLISGARYSWTAFDTGLNFVSLFGGARNAFFIPQQPGKYYIQMRIRRGNCETVMQYDSIESIGTLAIPMLLNNSQCESKDTVFFCNKSISYKAGRLAYMWKFVDDYADRCTTDTKNNLHIGKNCNFSKDENAKHKYDSSKCGEILFVVTDLDYGCKDSAREMVNIKKPLKSDISVKDKVQCLFRPVPFEKDSCLSDVQINYDSLCDKYAFIDFQNNFSYTKACDSTGWVTFGAAVRNGSNKIYRSCDTSDYYFDNDRVCNDTFWYHNAFRLNNSPRPHADIQYIGCLPSTLKGDFYVDTQLDVRKIIWDWGDGTFDTLNVHLDSLRLPKFEHTYTRSGDYEGFITMVTDSGCSAVTPIRREIGFLNDFTFAEPVCPGAIVQFIDTIRYWDDTTRYWRWDEPDFPPDLLTQEKVFWDFGDGLGFSDDLPYPKNKYVFNTVGNYTVRMVAVDKTGCTDTTTKIIEVVNINAGIRKITKKLLCDDIIQLFDSSTALQGPHDSIIAHYWIFGDGKAPSYLKNPFHFYSTYGDFNVVHVVENTMGCTDTAFTTVTINGPVPNFDILSDTVSCVPHTVEFQNNSIQATDYIWYFGDSSSSSNTLNTKSDTNVSFTYNNPGTYYIYLYAGDSVVNPDNNNNVYYCNSTFPDTTREFHAIKRVVILPIPEVDFTVDGVFCKNSIITLTDKSDTIYNDFRWYWSGDSAISQFPDVDIVLTDTGQIYIDYRPTYVPTGPYQRACYDSITKTITVFDNDAIFSFTKDSLCPTFYFTAIGDEEDEFIWDFGHPSSGPDNLSFQRYVEHSYADQVGSFEVCLTSQTKEGCIDSICEMVESDHEFNMFIPNVITPNLDQLNDVFEIDINGEDLYDLSIYNRWGELVYQSKEDYTPGAVLNWDGTEIKSGKPCPGGTYFYIFKYREACVLDAPTEKVSGIITVIRD